MKSSHVFLAGLVAISALAVSAVSIAHPRFDTEVTFYSDAAHTKVVGASELFCTGKSASWGEETSYSTTDSEPCDGGGNCSPISCG